MGIVIPKEAIDSGNLHEGETVQVLIGKKKNVLAELFGTVKFKRSTKEMLDEADKELWDDTRHKIL